MFGTSLRTSFRTACAVILLAVLLPLDAVTRTLAQEPGRAQDRALKIVVIDGDEAANIVADQIAAEPVIEVRDRRDRRVRGAVVRFVIRRLSNGGKAPATFARGGSELSALTDEAGRAAIGRVVPLEPGTFEIDIQATYQGQTAATTIRQTNFQTLADVKAAGRQPVQSARTPAPTNGAGVSGAAGGAAATGTAAGAGSGAAAGAAAGGGSHLLAGALIVGGAAAAGTAVALSRGGGKNADPSVQDIQLSRSVALASATPVTFSVAASDPDGNPLSYQWDFGDGASSAVAAPAHVYAAAGAFTASVTVSDGHASLRRSVSVTVKDLTGTWVTDFQDCRSFPNGPIYTCRFVYTLSQSGRSITGSGVIAGVPPQWDPGSVPMSGQTNTASPFVVVSGRFDIPIPSILQALADPDASIDTLIDTRSGTVYRRQ